MECHVGPDVPAYKVYKASKHGNIFSSLNSSWDFNAVPWTVGKDFTAPTCAACHMSLLVDDEETVIAERTHRISNRLGSRIFGLIYAHPQPKSPDTTLIRNKSGLPLPTDLDGTPASGFLIDGREQAARNQTMQAICLSCHSTNWVKGHWKRYEDTILETNAATLTATDILKNIWKDGFARGPGVGGSLADEAIEKKWMDIWLFHANTTRFAAAMAGGGDYGVYAGGRYQISKKILEINDWYQLRKETNTK
jgi:cytochrome c553